MDTDINGLAKQIGEAISQVNQAARPLIAHGWEVYVRQQYIGGVEALILNLLFGIPLLIASAIWLPKLFRWAKTYEYVKPKENEGVAYFVPGILSAALLAIFVVIIHNLADGAMHVFNPEYYAFQDILAQAGLNK